MPLLHALLLALRAAFRHRRQLVLENVALRHQLAVLRRQLKRWFTENRPTAKSLTFRTFRISDPTVIDANFRTFRIGG